MVQIQPWSLPSYVPSVERRNRLVPSVGIAFRHLESTMNVKAVSIRDIETGWNGTVSDVMQSYVTDELPILKRASLINGITSGITIRTKLTTKRNQNATIDIVSSVSYSSCRPQKSHDIAPSDAMVPLLSGLEKSVIGTSRSLCDTPIGSWRNKCLDERFVKAKLFIT